MTATELKLRRDTSADISAMTPAEGEPIYDITNKRLTVGDGSRAGGTPLASFVDVQNDRFCFDGSPGGSADAMTLAPTPAPSAYATGQRFTFKAGAANTGAVTVNVSSLGVKSVKKVSEGSKVALEAGDIASGGVYEIVYDGVDFQVAGGIGGGGKGKLVLLSRVSTAGVGVVDIELPVDYPAVLLVARNITVTTSGADLRMRFSTNGGGSFDNTTNYAYHSPRISPASTGYSAAASNAAGEILLTGGLTGTTPTTAMVLEIHYGTSGRRGLVFGNVSATISGEPTGGAILGDYNASGTVDYMRIFPNTGNVAGVFTLYGYEET